MFEPLFDFPVSYDFRCWEAWRQEGIFLPGIEPRENPIEERIEALEDAWESLRLYIKEKKMPEPKHGLVLEENNNV